MDSLDYERDMRIDETALDIEWLEQASLATRYGRHWAECSRAVARAEERLKVIKAQLIKRVGLDPVKYCGKEKPTVNDIEAFCQNHPKYKEVKEQVIEAQYELNMALVAKNEISYTRKEALEQLVTLYVSHYFAGPKVPRNLTQEREESQREVNKSISSNLKRKK